jgi:predicted phosphodiesterase
VTYLILGDIHGDKFWKSAMEKHEDAQHIIFLGDYCDPDGVSPPECLDNMVEIFELAKANPQRIHLLLGNHDYHYLGYTSSEYSRYNRRYAPDYEKTLKEYFGLFKMVQILNLPNAKFIVSHAGVSKTFLEDNRLTALEINQAWAKTPGIFDFKEFGENGFFSERHGNDRYQSPIWIRPPALLSDMVPGYNQIVGHTRVQIDQNLIFESADKLTLTVIGVEGGGNFACFDKNLRPLDPESFYRIPAKDK